jgi:L-seryl-tRNA(Ser) seleniumtransferase
VKSPEGSIVDGPKALLAKLPSVDRLISRPAAQLLVTRHGATLVTQQARELMAGLRQQILQGGSGSAGVDAALQPDALEAALAQRCAARVASRLRPMFNLTGTVIHTNLGRAVLPDSAIAHLGAI